MAHAGQNGEGRYHAFGHLFSVEQHGRSGSVRIYQLWLEWKLPGRVVPEWAMAMLHTKRSMIMEKLPTLQRKNLAFWCELSAPGESDILSRCSAA